VARVGDAGRVKTKVKLIEITMDDSVAAPAAVSRVELTVLDPFSARPLTRRFDFPKSQILHPQVPIGPFVRVPPLALPCL
jgi:hypothetical protein